MAIDPQILMMLMQQAPVLLSALQQFPGKFKSIEEALNRGFDPRLMQDRLGVVQDFQTGKIIPFSDPEALEGAADLVDSDMEYHFSKEPMGPGWGGSFRSDYEGDSSLGNLFKQLTLEEQQMIGGAPASLSAATFEANPPQVIPDPSGIGALYDEVAQDYKNGQFSDNNLYPVDPYTTPNPATGYSQEDWDFDEVDDAADNPYAKNALLEKIRKKRGK